MKVFESFDHKGGRAIAESKGDNLAELLSVLESDGYDFIRYSADKCRHLITSQLGSFGWSDRVTLGSSRLTISFLKDRIGVCIQLGNVSRTYADILKLLYLKKKNKIDCAIVVVPDLDVSKSLGQNYARFERLVREYQLFSEIIDCPTLILSLSRSDEV